MMSLAAIVMMMMLKTAAKTTRITPNEDCLLATLTVAGTTYYGVEKMRVGFLFPRKRYHMP